MALREVDTDPILKLSEILDFWRFFLVQPPSGGRKGYEVVSYPSLTSFWYTKRKMSAVCILTLDFSMEMTGKHIATHSLYLANIRVRTEMTRNFAVKNKIIKICVEGSFI